MGTKATKPKLIIEEIIGILLESPYTKKPTRALCKLLSEFKVDLPPLGPDFHRAFRQGDVTSYGGVDIAIWQLLDDSQEFWDTYERVRRFPHHQPPFKEGELVRFKTNGTWRYGEVAPGDRMVQTVRGNWRIPVIEDFKAPGLVWVDSGELFRHPRDARRVPDDPPQTKTPAMAVYSTNEHHHYGSRNLVGVAMDFPSVLRIIDGEQADRGHALLSEEQRTLLEKIRQTQSGEEITGEYMVEDIEIIQSNPQ